MSSVASSDWEYVAGVNDDSEDQARANEAEENQTVVVEVPGGVLPSVGVGGPSTGVSGGDQASETSSTRFCKGFVTLNLASTASSVSSQVSSSFAGFGHVGGTTAWTTHRSNNPDDETASSWSAIPSVGSTSAPDSTSVWSGSTSAYWSMPSANATSSSGSTGSVVSNFDVLSLGGTVRHRCKRCSFHNTETASICETCGLPLIANPCLDADLQVAINLQLKEEQNFHRDLQIREKKRKNIHSQPLFEQANFLVAELAGAVRQLGEPFESTDTTLLEGPSVLLALQFIEMVQKQGRGDNISIKFVLTPSDRFALRNLRCRGFGDSYEFGDDMETAINIFNRSGMARTGGPLFAVPEHKYPDEPYSCPALAWIVAVTESPTSPISATTAHDQSPIKACKVGNSGQILPLASFPATEVMISQENLNRASKLLNQVCEDFFFSEPTTEDDEAMARALAESFENEGAGSSSLRSSWPSWQQRDQKKPRVQPDAAVVDEVPSAVANGESRDAEADEPAVKTNTSSHSLPELFEVESAEMKDAFHMKGVKGVYTGTVDRESGLPHGKGSMKYILGGRTLDGEWCKGVFQHGQSSATNTNKDSSDDDNRKPSCDNMKESIGKDNETNGSISFTNNEEEPASDERIAEGQKEPNPGNLFLLGRRVQLLRGSFEGHIGTVASYSPDGNHLNVAIETIRNHSPTVLVSKVHVKTVGGQPQQDTQKQGGAPRSSADDVIDATRKVSHFLSVTSDI